MVLTRKLHWVAVLLLFLKNIIMYFFSLHNIKQRSTYKSWVAFLSVTSVTRFFALSLYELLLLYAQDAYSWIADSKF